MSNAFPNNIFLQGIFEPLSFEHDITDVKIIGKIPQELNGTFYRNGPNPQFVYSNNYHMFEGDGMLHAVHFSNGKVSYQNRWIRTDRFLAEHKAKRSLFGGMRDHMACDESVKDCRRNTANTNIIWHHQQLLALNEGGEPISIDRNDLRKCEIYTFNQVLNRSMMAHPKIDPVNQELLFYSYFGPDFSYFIANQYGKITYQEKIVMPYLCLMHDFAITENFSIFPLFPLTWDFRRIMQRESVFKWQPRLNTRFAIMPRYGKNEDVIWFEDKAVLGMHVVNAREEKDKIILEMIVMDEIPDDAIAFGDDNIIYTNYLTRWTFDLKSKKLVKERIDSINMEFPRIDERFTGRLYRNAYLTATVSKELPHSCFDAIVHYDFKNYRKQVHCFGNDAFPLEPIFVAKNKGAEEGEGFLLSYVYRKSEDRSDLVILDAQHIHDEPMASIQLPHRVPFGFHGSWVPD